MKDEPDYRVNNGIAKLAQNNRKQPSRRSSAHLKIDPKDKDARTLMITNLRIVGTPEVLPEVVSETSQGGTGRLQTAPRGFPCKGSNLIEVCRTLLRPGGNAHSGQPSPRN